MGCVQPFIKRQTRSTLNDNKWQGVLQGTKTAQYTLKDGWLPSLLWQKQIHCFKVSHIKANQY